jgi:hypothetical protein
MSAPALMTQVLIGDSCCMCALERVSSALVTIIFLFYFCVVRAGVNDASADWRFVLHVRFRAG